MAIGEKYFGPYKINFSSFWASKTHFRMEHESRDNEIFSKRVQVTGFCALTLILLACGLKEPLYFERK
jgi:hypothetical protein